MTLVISLIRCARLTGVQKWAVPHDFVRIKKPGFNVPIEVKETLDRGKGLFALDTIPAGALVWKLVPGAIGHAGCHWRKSYFDFAAMHVD